jgi:hypothetical protein|eukprot:9629-Pelagococcus_subviridis.AAC.4
MAAQAALPRMTAASRVGQTRARTRQNVLASRGTPKAAPVVRFDPLGVHFRNASRVRLTKVSARSRASVRVHAESGVADRSGEVRFPRNPRFRFLRSFPERREASARSNPRRVAAGARFPAPDEAPIAASWSTTLCDTRGAISSPARF